MILKRILSAMLIIVVCTVLLPVSQVFAAPITTKEVSVIFDSEAGNRKGLSFQLDGTGRAVETIDKKTVWKIDKTNVNFFIDPNTKIEGDEKWQNAKRYRTFDVTIPYYDRGFGGFYLQYDSYSGLKHIFVQCLDTETWKTARIRLYDARFCSDRYDWDFRIVTKDKPLMPYSENNSSTCPVYLSSISVNVNNKYSGFEINADSHKPGNVFYHDEEIKFDIHCKNVDGNKYDNVNVMYSVYRPEEDDMHACWANGYSEKEAYSERHILQKSGNPVMSGNDVYDTISFSGLSFNTYVLKVEMEAQLDGKPVQSMTYITDFAYSRRGETNYHFGANTHYDDYYESGDYKGNILYTEKDLRDQIDLMKGSGFGFVRSGLRWSDIQKKDGVLRMPSVYIYAYKYLHQNGLWGLANLTAGNALGLGTAPYYADLGLTKQGVDAFANYARYVALSISPYTKYYSMPNEYDLAGTAQTGRSGDRYDQPNELSYKYLTEAAYMAIKDVQPDAWINTGEIAEDPKWQYGYEEASWKNKWTWDTRLYRLGVMDYADSISYHRYTSYGNTGPESSEVLGFVKYGMIQKNKFAPEKQCWVTEVGWPARMTAPPSTKSEYYNVVADRRTEYIDQAKFYARALAIHSDPKEIDRFIFYEFQDDRDDPFSWEENFGLIHARMYRTPWAAKPSYLTTAAFNYIVGEAVESQSLGTPLDYEYYNMQQCSKMVYKITNKKGEKIWCVWCNERATGQKYTVDTNMPYALVYDMYGNLVKVVEGGKVELTARTDIQYVKGANAPTEELYVTKDGAVIESIDDLSNGKNIILHYTENSDIKSRNLTFVFAAYKDGVLTYTQTADRFYNTGINIDRTMEQSFTLNKLSQADEIRFFVFDNLNGIRPISKKYVLKRR